ncbi:MAG TPA: pitrilysin family protein, partial [Thermoanaerobaculia bacterium]
MTLFAAPLRPFLRLLALLLVLGGPGLAACSSTPAAIHREQAAPAPVPTETRAGYDPADLDAPLPVDSTVRVGTLENGLRYYVRRNTSPEERAELWLVVDAGSTLEEDSQRGLAHFVEHMAFNGTRNFEHQELVAYLESIGMRFGPDINAFTSFDETIYMLQVPTDREGSLETGLEILEDWADGILFDPQEIEQERGVLIEEWRLDRGAGRRMIDAQTPVLFSQSRYAERQPIGTLDVLRGASREDLVRFYEDWYRPDLMAVIAVGHFDALRVERMVKERFRDLENPDEAPVRWTPDLPEHEDTLFATFTDPELTGTSVAVFTKLPRPPEGTGRDYRSSLVETLYHAMLNDRLYEVGHRPDPPYLYAFSDSDTIVRAGQVDQQEVGVEPGRALEGLSALLTEIERVRRHGFTEGELARTKLDLLRAYEQAVVERDARSSGSFAAEYSRAFLVDEPIPGIDVEVDMVTTYLPTITLEEVEALASRRTGDANRVILVSAPEAQAETLPSNDQLLATFREVRSLELAPYEDVGVEADLLAETPEPGEIVERREIEEIGVTEWKLSNGATVVVKPTDFRNDEVFLVGFSPGGHSTLSSERYLSGSYAAEIVALGGLGELDEIALAKALAGQVADVGPYVEELEE